MNTKPFMLIILVVMMSIMLYGCGRGGGDSGGGSSHSSSDDKGNSNINNNSNSNSNSNNSITNNTNNSNDNNDNNVVGIGNSGGSVKDIAYYEGLCKKYLGQPQKAGLPIPDTYADAIEYFNQTLFFFPDDPKDMTEEQKDLYSAPCFWSGMKYRFVYNENVTTDAKKIKGISPNIYYSYYTSHGRSDAGIQLEMPKFDQPNMSNVDRSFNFYRYFVFTRAFFKGFIAKSHLDSYCSEMTNSSSPYYAKTTCSSDTYKTFTTSYIDVQNNYYISTDPNPSLFGHRYSDKEPGMESIDALEILLVIRNMRFGSIDGNMLYANIKNAVKVLGRAGVVATSEIGIRGYIDSSLPDTRDDIMKAMLLGASNEHSGIVSFKPDWNAIFDTMNKYGEVALDIGRDSQNRVNEHYVSDYRPHDTERSEIKNVTPKVIYLGFMPDYRTLMNNEFSSPDPNMTSLDYKLKVVYLHEPLHLMGYMHLMDYRRGLDVAYYLTLIMSSSYVDSTFLKKFETEVSSGNIKPYYHTTSQECIDYDVTLNAIVPCR